MKRLQRTALMLSLMKKLKNRGSWCGETHIQKAAFFLQKLLEIPLGYDFILYKHGPYSFDLTEDLTAMRADGLVKMVSQPYPYGPTMVAKDTPVMQQFDEFISQYESSIDFVAENLGGKGVAELERLATALYVTLEDGTRLVEDRAKRVNELKPHVSIDQALEAVKEVDQLKTKLQ
ncbi:MAG TPA: hypothetical protein PKA28_15625 [Methylomusa anaerophila]|uniref:Antitoxin SocA-like Panacea domain-containing protein n=1 Tax=Methylomusa anaerophila TaxID=1930071 RepID=A0A348AHD6_9FIRM|nr:hypothetical protein [Methylomusa anaerophila]BBB90484.1 hypothetical protein MAMMFC1_01135 [Methylomusa anaerophila]HML89873.1 hypothetical protein [Methylomusa anaerophila]